MQSERDENYQVNSFTLLLAALFVYYKYAERRKS